MRAATEKSIVNWWDSRSAAFEHVCLALNRMNAALRSELPARAKASNDERVLRQWEDQSRALALLAQGYDFAIGASRGGEADRVRHFVESLNLNDEVLFENSAFQTLVTRKETELVQDEDVIQAARRGRLRELNETEKQEARKRHRELIAKYNTFRDQRTARNRKEVGKRLGDVLYMVRCNVEHAGKYPGGPDLQKADRDKTVLGWTLPVLRAVLRLALDNPDHRFAVYGTFRLHRDPGEEDNHRLIADLGQPEIAAVAGLKLYPEYARPDPVYRWEMNADEVKMEVYESPLLTAERWARYDAFENNGFVEPVYRRAYVPVKMADRAGYAIATAYVDARA